MGIKTTTRKWGNSIGIRLPKEFVKKKNLKENMEVRVEVITKNDFDELDEVFGSLKRKGSGQEIKDLGREGWKE